jgi:hypothetical protein
MDKKITKKDNSAADDLFSSLLEDVGGFDNLSSDPDEILEATVYDDIPKDENETEISLPSFNVVEKEVSVKRSNELHSIKENNNFWENAGLIDQNKSEISFSDIPTSLGTPSAGKYDGPGGDDNFLDQIKFNLAPPEHAGGYVKVNTAGSDLRINAMKQEDNSNDDYSPLTTPEYDSGNVVNSNQPPEKMDGLNLDYEDQLKSPKIDKTEVVSADTFKVASSEPSKNFNADVDKTIAVTKFAQRQNHHINSQPVHDTNASSDEKVFLMTQKSGKTNTSQISIDASLAQAENLRIAQNRIIDLEKEIERLRQENDEILTASEIIRNKSEEFTLKISQLEKENVEIKSEYKNENSLLKGSLVFKDSENSKLQEKVEELEVRIKNDFKKIRIRERELENRLELMKAEKQAVVKSKDELLLELQRKNDISKSELETYRNKVQELNKTIESYQNQIKITVRTLRLALSHVEDKGDNQPIQYKKAT